jgi:hypothetical protein
VNYIRHLNAFFSFVRSDKRLTSSNVSLYFALFYYWNFNRFNNPFTIYRENILQLSKLSKNTYHKSIKQLHEAKYIYYHKSSSRFQEVRISIARLDLEEQTSANFKQLELFPEHSSGKNSPEATTIPTAKSECNAEEFVETLGRNIETDTVPNLVPTSTKIDTDTVANLRHSINQTFFKQNGVQQTHTVLFEKNREISKKLNGLLAHQKSGCSSLMNRESPQGATSEPQQAASKNLSKPNQKTVSLTKGDTNKKSTDNHLPDIRSRVVGPSLIEVEKFFRQNNNSLRESHKFYYYNQGKNWMLTDKLPIYDWKALARKWLLNINPQNEPPMDLNTAIQSVYELYLNGERINKLLLPEFADHLQLQISDAVKQEAIRRRINQLSGTNENSQIQLWKAYMQQELTSELVIKDEPNLLALAKRLAVSRHFQQLKSNHQKNVFPTDSA